MAGVGPSRFLHELPSQLPGLGLEEGLEEGQPCGNVPALLKPEDHRFTLNNGKRSFHASLQLVGNRRRTKANTAISSTMNQLIQKLVLPLQCVLFGLPGTKSERFTSQIGSNDLKSPNAIGDGERDWSEECVSLLAQWPC